jgi:hypothetical protein
MRQDREREREREERGRVSKYIICGFAGFLLSSTLYIPVG